MGTGSGEPWPSKAYPRRPNAAILPLPQSARKWHKINMFLDVARKQSNKKTKQLCFIKDGSILPVRPQADENWLLFRNGTPIWSSVPFKPITLSGSAIDDPTLAVDFFFLLQKSLFIPNQNKDGTASDAPCQMFQKSPLHFSWRSYDYDNKTGSSQYNLVAACCQRQLSAIVLYVWNIIF